MNNIFTRKDLDDLLNTFKEYEDAKISLSVTSTIGDITNKYLQAKTTEFIQLFLFKVGSNSGRGFYQVREASEHTKMLFVQHMNEIAYWKDKKKEMFNKAAKEKENVALAEEVVTNTEEAKLVTIKTLLDQFDFKTIVELFFEYLKKNNCECTIRKIEEFKL